MVDEKIVNLYWNRSDDAILETSKKYGHYCHSIAYNILRNNEDSEECVNDTYYNAWNSIPPKRPNNLALFLGRITRNLALNKYEYYTAQKRGSAQVDAALDELIDCVSSTDNIEDTIDEIFIGGILDDFLSNVSKMSRKIFICRYWYFLQVKEIALMYGLSETYVKVSLHRSRKALKEILKKEGIY